ncbi:Uncharacterised protein [Vibrio cholerae]|nr:Uncharacterised protein [Vibrio cholerae]
MQKRIKPCTERKAKDGIRLLALLFLIYHSIAFVISQINS